MDALEELGEGRARLLATGVFLAMLFVWIAPIVDVIGTAWPLQPANIRWRFVAISSSAPTAMTQSLSMGLGMVLAFGLGWRTALRLMSAVSLLMALVGIALVVLYAMDFLQLRKLVPVDGRLAFKVAVFRASLQLSAGSLVAVVLGLGARRAAVRLGDARKARPPERVVLLNQR